MLFCLSLILCINICLADYVDVNTTSGVVRGHTLRALDQNINEFLGIPFSEPPIGEKRFAKPEPITIPFPDIIIATKPRDSCLQPVIKTIESFIGNLTYSEDCLYLNIWTTNVNNNSINNVLKPVMFWIHGGGLVVGSSFQFPTYNGSALAAQDVIMVSTNYRLGSFGFLYGNDESAPGNQGYYDQILALKWVRKNIHMFGGDKNQITIFGESAGSWSVSVLVLSPLSKGLFKRAIMESGSHLYNKDRNILTPNEALINAKALAIYMNCTDDKHWLQCLRKIDEKVFKENQILFLVYPLTGTELLPISAQQAFAEEKFNKVDIISGVAREEGSSLAYMTNPEIETKNLTEQEYIDLVNATNSTHHNFNVKQVAEFYVKNVRNNTAEGRKWAYFDIFGDLSITCPTYQFAKQYAQHSNDSNVFFYQITYQLNKVNEKLFDVTHGADIDFVFGLPLLNHSYGLEIDRSFSKEVIEMWTNFAKYGKPNDFWPKLLDSKGVIKVKELNPYLLNHNIENLFNITCDGFWKNYY